MQSAKRIGVPAVVVRTIDEADALITLRSYYRDHQATIVEAEQRGMPIYVLRANSVNQIEQFLTDLFSLPGSEGSLPGPDEELKHRIELAGKRRILDEAAAIREDGVGRTGRGN